MSAESQQQVHLTNEKGSAQISALSTNPPDAAARIRKCTGCKLPHEAHSWGEPSPYCTGPPNSADLTGEFGAEDEKDEEQDEHADENALIEHHKKMKIKEQELEKAARVKQLKLEIAQSQTRLAELQKFISQPDPPVTPSLPVTSTQPSPVLPTTQAAASVALSSATLTVASSLSSAILVPAVVPAAIPTTSQVTPLDALLAGHRPGAAPQGQVNNPEGALYPRIADVPQTCTVGKG